MYKFANVLISLAVFAVLAGCQRLEVPEDPDPGPHQTLLSIVRMTQANDFTGLDDLIYSIEVGVNIMSGDKIKEGIINQEKLADFAYSPEKFLLAATKFKDLFQPISATMLDEFFLRESAFFRKNLTLLTMAENEPEKIWEFRRGISRMIFIEENGVYKILFNQSMTSLE